MIFHKPSADLANRGRLSKKRTMIGYLVYGLRRAVFGNKSLAKCSYRGRLRDGADRLALSLFVQRQQLLPPD
ncbi:hypothetical protein CEXT_799651 [Caerostris extrusa]|uniref:Transposase n=1 Tax=Caerostris extrusa TaxID=172846 RepID=A0AAV4M3U4_CAEEX|nr:hypothetical protein CEXT_799651 [Caerostris extrusa]